MYPLLVACKSQSNQRRDAAMSVVEAVRIHSAALVEQAQLVRPRLRIGNNRRDPVLRNSHLQFGLCPSLCPVDFSMLTTVVRSQHMAR